MSAPREKVIIVEGKGGGGWVDGKSGREKCKGGGAGEVTGLEV